MIIYNVTVKVDLIIAHDWLKWMKEVHQPELMQTGLFTDCRLCHLIESEEEISKTYVAQYFCKNIEDYEKYIADFAPKMREKGHEKWSNHFVAFRTVMEIV